MTTLRREDGIQFAIQSYRECLNAKKKSSLLKQEIRRFARDHGEFVSLFKREGGQVEAVFSRDPGYLLGETVWDYFGRPRDLIYCEALGEREQVLIVVVQAGNVYLDARLPYGDLIDEFAHLVTGHHQYDIYVVGDVPLSETNGGDQFVFEPAFVQSFTCLNKSVFAQLPSNPLFLLQPLGLALASQRLGKRSMAPYLAAAAVVFVVLAVLTWHEQHDAQTSVVTIHRAPTEQQPYRDYDVALMTPAPEAVLTGLVDTITMAYGLPGWAVRGVAYNGTQYTITCTSDGGTVAALAAWAQANAYQLRLTTKAAYLSRATGLTNRERAVKITKLQPLLIFLMDRVPLIMPDAHLTIGQIASHGASSKVPLSVGLQGVSPDVLLLIGHQMLQGLPIKLSSVSLTLDQQLLLSGTINFSALGN